MTTPPQRPNRPSCVKRCERCGTEFLCGPAAGKDKCWCDDLPSVGPIAGAACDCLCPACLRAAIEKHKSTPLTEH
jgi:uncharacterized protein